MMVQTFTNPRRLAAAAGLLAFLAAGPALAASALPKSVPPYTPPSTRTLSTQAALQATTSAPASRVVVLPAPTSAELSAVPRAAGAMRLQRTNVGIGRAVPDADRVVTLDSLTWTRGADGSAVATIKVTSTGAAALRVALRMATGADPDAVVRVAGADGAVYGPYAANAIAQATATLGEWWTPVVDGDTITLELAAPAASSFAGGKLTLAEVSHLTRAGSDLRAVTQARDGNLGTSGSCEVNWKCAPNQSTALTNSASSTARMIFTEADGNSWLCTGTLLNDSKSSGTAYFATAAHCMDNAYAAQTLNTYWFLDAPDGDCGHTAEVGAFVRLTGGAMLLGRSQAEDWALVRLYDAPPAGVNYSAWNSTAITSSPIIALHHPSGDTKKYSDGTLTPGDDDGYVDVIIRGDDGLPEVVAPLMQVYWTTGVTEGGSSGSGLLTSTNKGYYEFRGALTGADEDLSCAKPQFASYYSRLDRMLPLVRDYLTPGSTVANTAVVVEYYSATLDAYFITASADDQNALDTGIFAGWARTGARFLAYTAAVNGAVGVCRFYQIPAYGDSHFYGLPADCAAVTNNPTLFPGWVLEHPAAGKPNDYAFYVQAPTAAGGCPSGTTPIWRFFHSSRTNHRFTSDPVIKVQLDADSDWDDEGVRMCAPVGS